MHQLFIDLIHSCYDHHRQVKINDDNDEDNYEDNYEDNNTDNNTDNKNIKDQTKEGISNYPDLQKIVADIKEQGLDIPKAPNSFLDYIETQFRFHNWSGIEQYGTLYLLYQCEMIITAT